jgi:hypothetical protein
MNLTAIYNSFNADEPLSSDDDPRHVDLSGVWCSRVARKLVQRIKNAGEQPSHHLLMGHTKCGKTTELLRTAQLLQKEGYITVFYDVAESATRSFEYTTLLLLMVGEVADTIQGELAKLGVTVDAPSTTELKNFLRTQEVTVGKELSGEATGKTEAKIAPSFLGWVLGELGLGVELKGGFKRSREVSSKIEADISGFLKAVNELIQDAKEKIWAADLQGLVVICDGCDKLDISATDEKGVRYDLQRSMFVDHATELLAVPCHVIYTVPISIPENLGDIWKQSPEVIPAIPVSQLPGVDDGCPKAGREALREVVKKRLNENGTKIEELFADADLLEELISISGGHISDLLLLVHDAVLEAQTDDAPRLESRHIRRAVRRRAQEYTRLIESKYLPILATIDRFKTSQSNSEEYRQLIFKRLVLEYVCENETRVDLHPLVAASSAYRNWTADADPKSDTDEDDV